MAYHEADPRFDAFTNIVPYTNDPLAEEPRPPAGRGITDHPVTAKDQAEHETGNPLLSSSDSETTRCVSISDSTRSKILHMSDLLERSLKSEPDSKVRGNLDSNLKKCSLDLAIDFGRLVRCAVSNGKLRMCKHLVEYHGADLRSRDILGRSPIIYAFIRGSGSTEILDYFADEMSQKALQSELNHQDAFGRTALHYASYQENSDALHFCIKQGCDPSICENNGNSLWQIPSKGGWKSDNTWLTILLYTHLKAHLNLPIYFSGVFEDRKEVIMRISDLNHTVGHIEGRHMQWVHIPCTDGSLIYAALRRIMIDYSSDDDRFPWDWINQDFDSPSTISRDPQLNYRAPSCLTRVKRYQGRNLHVPALVFPCLLLQPIGQFRILREDLRSQRESADSSWGDAGKYFHIERTLDEAYSPSLTPAVLSIQNQRQVVTRECTQTANGTLIPDKSDSRPILMVRQFWIWRARNWVISAYTPSGKDAEHAMGEQIRESVSDEAWKLYGLGERKPYDSIRSPEQHIAWLLGHQVRRFGEVHGAEKFQSPLDIFETGVVRVMTGANKYIEKKDLATDDSKIELELMNDIADIRDELAMVGEILRQQEMVLDDFTAHIKLVQSEQQKLNESKEQTELLEIVEVPSEIADAKAQIKKYRERVSRIDHDAERVDKTVQDRLNAKRTFASIHDARASILLAIAVIGFTVITILFAPLAFVTALFALNIDELANHKVGKGDDVVYPSRYIVWTFFAAEVTTIIVTGLIVVCFLHYKDQLVAWAEKIAPNSKGAEKSKSDAAKEKEPAEPTTEAQRSQTSAVDQNQGARSSTFSKILQRRPHAANPADEEERGEAKAPG